jgi:hypothetical protein
MGAHLGAYKCVQVVADPMRARGQETFRSIALRHRRGGKERML